LQIFFRLTGELIVQAGSLALYPTEEFGRKVYNSRNLVRLVLSKTREREETQQQ
jgi:hypothetical protein